MRTATALHPAARAILWLDVVVAFGSGLILFAFARDADTSFAWTIKAPMTAAFLGAGYWAAMVGLVLAALTREWQRVRIVFVIGLVLTTLVLLPTFVYLDQFHLDEGSAAAKRIAWLWVVLYLVQPVVVLAIFVLHERAGGRHERDVMEPLLPWLRLVVGALALALLAVAVALWPLRADGFWPWPLTDLGAGAMATWLVAFAAGAAWTLREADWRRVRIAFPVSIVFLVLLLVAALRFSDAFDGGAWQTWTWVGAIVLSIALLTLGSLQQELVSRRRAVETAAVAEPA